MAIFTSVANYLKCRFYFESILGFRLIDKYPDESIQDYNDDVHGFTISEGNSLTASTPDPSYGILCRRSNRIVARNIWFLFGKANSWINDEDPPKEIEDGFVIRNDVSGNEHNGECGFVLDPVGVESSFEFIGMKRLLPVEDDGTENSRINNPSIISQYKDIVQFAKLIEGSPAEKLSSYDTTIVPQNQGDNGLYAKEPNSLVIKTAYDYNDFGFNPEGKEYNIRQLGMMTNLHVMTDKQSTVAANNTLFNGMTPSVESTNNLNSLLNITDNSIIVPSTLILGDRFTSIVGSLFDYNDITEQFLINELHLDDGTGTPRAINTAVDDETNFFGILQFYINTMPNNRITYQTDTYNFILSFENQIKCSCTCENCEQHRA